MRGIPCSISYMYIVKASKHKEKVRVLCEELEFNVLIRDKYSPRMTVSSYNIGGILPSFVRAGWRPIPPFLKDLSQGKTSN